MRIFTPLSPALPTPTQDYVPENQTNLRNVLRLYFNRLDGAFKQLLLGFNGYGSFFSAATQASAGAGSENLVTFTDTVNSVDVDIDGTTASKINLAHGGVYLVTYALQMQQSGALADGFVWAKVNGTAVSETATRLTLPASSGLVSVKGSFLIKLDTGGYFQLAWSAAPASATLIATAASSPVPRIPAAVLLVQYVFPGGATE